MSTTPRPQNPLLVVVCADDPTAISTLPDDYGQQWREATRGGRTATARLADHLGVGIEVADSADLTGDHDLLLLADVGKGLTTAAAQVACTHFNAEPQLVCGYGSDISDLAWMQKVAAIRRTAAADPEAPLPHALGVLVSVIETAAGSGTPVLLDGVVSSAAAAMASVKPPMQSPTTGDEPAQKFFLDRADIGVWAGSGIGPGAGLAALGGLALLNLGLLAADV
ncbi:MAG: nicotinate-nucleotide--dimethylbenzimidazole phosphoribosyltransferase [Candidatus Nanopelagicales bacterium]